MRSVREKALAAKQRLAASVKTQATRPKPESGTKPQPQAAPPTLPKLRHEPQPLPPQLLRWDEQRKDLYHQPLRGEEIRALVILPASQYGAPIECRLIILDLSETPTYEALSYVWGDPNDRYAIDVNGHSFAVWSNLYAALLRLRKRDEERLVWIDAICINQNDARDKSSQVQRMGQIYSLAARTVVWLGRGAGWFDDVDIAFAVSEAIADAFTAFATARGLTVWALNITKIWQLTVERMVIEIRERLAGTRASSASVEEWWKALDSLFDAAWFERIWCVQEAVLARKIVFMADESMTTAEGLGVCALWLVAEALRTGKPFFSESRFVKVQSCMSRCGALAHRLRAGTDGAHTLLLLLGEHRTMKATNARDKVYALLGVYETLGVGAHKSKIDIGKPNSAKSGDPLMEPLAKDLANVQVNVSTSENPASDTSVEEAAGLDASAIVVDYDKSLDQVYLDAAIACTDILGTLDILGHVEHTSESLQAGQKFPSWVPRWDEPLRTNLIDDLREQHWNASGTTVDRNVQTQKFQLIDRVLKVQGLIIGRITFESQVVSKASLRSCLVECWNDVIDVLGVSDGESVGGGSRSGANLEGSTRGAGIATHSRVEGQSHSLERAAVAKMVRTWGLGKNEIRQWIDQLDDAAVALLSASFLGSVKLAQEAAQTVCQVPPEHLAAAMNVDLAAAGKDSGALIDSMFFDRALGRHVLWLTPGKLSTTQVTANTRGGSDIAGVDYGMGPAIAKVGDVVTILHGTSVPYVLRPDGDRWLLVGQCYFEGLMRGELFQKDASGQMPAEQYEACEFFIH